MSLEKFWKNGFEFKNLDQRVLIILGLLIFIAFIYFKKDDIVSNLNTYELNKTWLKADFEKEFFGVVSKKGDGSNHNELYFEINNSKKIFDDAQILNQISIGDSVAKKRNSKILEIIRKDKIIKISYDDMYKYRDSLMRAGKS